MFEFYRAQFDEDTALAECTNGTFETNFCNYLHLANSVSFICDRVYLIFVESSGSGFAMH